MGDVGDQGPTRTRISVSAFFFPGISSKEKRRRSRSVFILLFTNFALSDNNILNVDFWGGFF